MIALFKGVYQTTTRLSPATFTCKRPTYAVIRHARVGTCPFTVQRVAALTQLRVLLVHWCCHTVTRSYTHSPEMANQVKMTLSIDQPTMNNILSTLEKSAENFVVVFPSNLPKIFCYDGRTNVTHLEDKHNSSRGQS